VTDVVVERFYLVDRVTCVCGGPVIISPVFGSDLDRMFAVARHQSSLEHRDYRSRTEADAAYYGHPETPLTPSVVEHPSIERSSVGPDGEPGVTTRGVGTRPQHSGGVSTSHDAWTLEDELYPGVRR